MDVILNGKINKLKKSIGKVDKFVEGFIDDEKNYVKTKKNGKQISDDNAIDKPLLNLRVYGKMQATNVVQSNQLLNLNNGTRVSSGITWICTNGVVTANGTTTFSGTTGYIQYYLPVEAGTYKISGGATGITIYALVTKADDSTTEYRQNATSVFTLDGTEKSVLVALKTTMNVTLDNVTFYPMINKGTTALPFEQYQATNVINNVGSETGSIEITCGNNKITQPIESYGLPSLKLTLTSNTKESEFTYSDEFGNIYLADYIDYSKGLYYHNIGYIESYNGENIGSNYVSNTYGGVTNGDQVFYVLSTPYTTQINSQQLSQFSTFNLKDSVLTSDAMMTADYAITKDIDYNVNAVLHGSLDIGTDNARAIAVDGRYAYIGTRKSTVIRVDCGVESALTVTHTKQLDTLNMITGIAINGNYLYVVDRDVASWTGTTPSATIGHLYIVNKADLTLVNTIVLSYKGTGVYVYKNYLYVPQQVFGWAVYNLTNPALPVKIYENSNALGSVEFQRCQFFTQDNIDYMVATGFEHGLWFYNVTNPLAPVLVGEVKTIDIIGVPEEQIFDCYVEYPYVYCTVSTLTETRYISNQYRGLLKIKIDNILPPNNFEITEFEYAGIEKDAWWEYIGEGDNQPNMMARLGDLFITNNGNKGLAIFRASDKEFRYLKTASVLGEKGIMRPVVATSDGRVMCATDASNFSKKVFNIYRVTGVNY